MTISIELEALVKNVVLFFMRPPKREARNAALSDEPHSDELEKNFLGQSQ
jgi:hypothetical protein